MKPEQPAQPSIETTPEGCVIQRFTVPSPSMKREIQAEVVLPPEYAQKPDNHYPVLFAMHGMDAPYDSWAEMPKLKQELVTHPMIVVCFNGDAASFYIDAPKKSDSQFTTFFFKELIPYIDSHYRSITSSKGRAVTGFSMGGYGAFHYMLEKPNAFASVSGLSTAFCKFDKNISPEKLNELANSYKLTPLLGSAKENPAAYHSMNLFTGIQTALDNKTVLPPIYFHCGTEDFLLSENRAINDLLKSRGVSFDYLESSGAHHWSFWKNACVGILQFHWKHFHSIVEK